VTTERALTVHRDERGSVREAFRASWYTLPPIVQVVHSESVEGVLRGMHAHKRQYDVWHFTRGRALVQTFDHRTNEWNVYRVGPGQTLVIPPGVSHGFEALSDVTLTYFLTEEYDGSDEFQWDAYSEDFPGADTWSPSSIRSERDMSSPSLADFRAAW